jgi:hypothetical protein
VRPALARAAAALRAFARGFLGLAAASPREPEALHRHLDERARKRTTCC